jgi:LDH2 family malate/lactate/ureidoglycolate dehydrogenase
MAYTPVNYDNRRYMPESLLRFTTEVFEKAGMSAEHAAELAGYLVATDLRGVLSHGTGTAAGYAQSFKSAEYNPRPEISVTREAGATIQYDGDGGVGHLCSARAVRGAIDKARQFGIGLALGRYCGHTGSIGNWTRIATAEGMIALFTSTAVSPSDYETVQTVTNVFRDYPFSMGFPAPEGLPPIVIDMGTLLAPLDVQEQIAEITTLPLIKGFALQMISLMLTMPIANMHPATPDPFPGATCNFTTVVINPAFLGNLDDYYAEGRLLFEALHRMSPMPGLEKVIFPGELEAEREIDFRANGIPLDPGHMERLATLGDEFKVPPYWE